ncbi:phage tail protein [Teredinibacter turnerae]|uniref:phage tail-collar fiber domain-containing protein n=1 Tax=Teredinibacter turnerae TaxID=2426 RepID=UPI0003A5F8FC|nr:phage tail protein [Teredinibacter turnerae]
MALVLTITDAGRAALVNASNTGTLPITLTTVAFGSGNYTPSQHQTELQAPFKNLQTFSGDVVAADQIHLTVRDESEDHYTLNELGLITETGVLFAVYSHPTTSILEKAAAGVVLLSVDATVTGDIAQNISFGDTNFLLPAATETTAGVIAKATSSEALARLSHTKTLTPKTGGELLAAHETATEAHTWLQIANKPAQATRWPAWTEITSKPTVYPAASHLHAWGELTGLPAYATRWPSWSEVTDKPASFTAASHTHSWSSITEKPATFTATAHSHPWADLTGVPTQATRWPAWGEVTSKPTNFVPSAHSHPWADLTGVPTQATRWPAWGEVTDKPTAFTPISHTHAWSAITGAPAHRRRPPVGPVGAKLPASPPVLPPAPTATAAAKLPGWMPHSMQK